MSGVPDDLNTRDILARIDRQLAETRKFSEESIKLAAEARKLDRNRWLAPWLAVAGIVGGVVAIATLILRAFNLPH